MAAKFINMKIDWRSVKAYIIAWTIIIVVVGVSYLPIASLIINGDLSWARDFWKGFGSTVNVVSEVNFFYVLIPTSILSGLGWILDKIFPDNLASKILTIFYPILAISFLVFVFTGYQDASSIGLRP